MPERSSHLPVSMMNDLGKVQVVREGFSPVSLILAPFIYDEVERRFTGKVKKKVHNVAFHSNLCLRVIIAVTSTGGKGAGYGGGGTSATQVVQKREKIQQSNCSLLEVL